MSQRKDETWEEYVARTREYRKLYMREYMKDPARIEAAKESRKRWYWERGGQNWHRQKKYGITQEQFDSLLAAQENKCAICVSELEATKGTHVDHDHETGKVRGILCQNCNRGLGMFKDSSELMSRAILYIRTSSEKVGIAVPADGTN